MTVTVRRAGEDITVALAPSGDGWRILCAMDEAGDDIDLSATERAAAIHFAECGMDEAGYDEDDEL
jgi:hypothetical protein